MAVLLATYNGAAFLREQLQSLADQDHQNIDVWLSDHGSVDTTVVIAETFAEDWPKGAFSILELNRHAPGGFGHPFDEYLAGSNRNFYSLIKHPELKADYYAFCDQDDIWEQKKLSRATQWLADQDPDRPAMYCSRTRIIDEEGLAIGESILFSRPPCFANAIVQNIAAGNTIVMNGAAFNAVRSSMVYGEFVSHDWWVYIVVTALGGVVKYDEKPTTCYRQHATNLIGENASWRARMVRMKFVLEGRFARWNEINLRGLSRLYPQMPPESHAIIHDLQNMREKKVAKRMHALYRSRIHRQTRFGQASLYIACLFGKI